VPFTFVILLLPAESDFTSTVPASVPSLFQMAGPVLEAFGHEVHRAAAPGEARVHLQDRPRGAQVGTDVLHERRPGRGPVTLPELVAVRPVVHAEEHDAAEIGQGA
jgi:hypothetical protein